MTIKTPTKAQIKAAEVAAAKRDAFHKKAASLLGHVRFAYGQANAAYDQGLTAEAYAALVAAKEPVGAAVHPVKANAIEAAEVEARKVVAKVAAELEGADWNVDAVAPYPRALHETRESYRRKEAKYRLFHSITRSTCKGSRRPGEPNTVEIALDRVETFVNETREQAALDYDAFIVKLVAKIGAGAVDAKLDGNHVWGHSILTVTKEDGTTERWFTQQITNYSVYGRPYAQWPTRRKK